MAPALFWAVAIALLVVGAYSDANWPELIGWGLVFLTGGFIVGHLPWLGKTER